MRRVLNQLVKERFPPVLYACGYGSGVFKQGSTPTKGKMVDVMFVVSKASQWHKDNMTQNPADYSFLPRYVMSYDGIESIQRHYGGSMWFNTLIDCESSQSRFLLKYGVISVEDCIEDCSKWSKLYFAGRLQKPVLDLDPTELSGVYKQVVTDSIHLNRVNALRAALAVNPARKCVPLEQLFEDIVGLSYGGDVRVGLAESPTKVKDIVKGNFEEMRDLYLRLDVRDGILNSMDAHTVGTTLDFRSLVDPLPGRFGQVKDADDLRKQLASTIQRSSFTQTAKGFLTAGLTKSIKYGFDKVQKRFR